MAEKYGVKPKIFTKEWFPYFWLYNKWYVLIGVLIAFSLSIGIYEKVTKVIYDLEITYLGSQYISDDEMNAITEKLTPLLEDADGDGEANLFMSQIVVSDTKGREGENYSLRTKHDLEFGNEFKYLYIYDRNELELIDKSNVLSETYLPVAAWYEGSESDVYVGDDGVAYAIALKNSTFIKNIGLDSEELYIAVKNDEIDKTINKTVEKNAITVANIIAE